MILRAELAAAHVLAKLLKYCSELLGVTEIHAWSDSAIVLCWLRKSQSTLKQFVHNRVKTIQQLIPTAQLRHISTRENPADLLSKGMTAQDLVECRLWCEGPSWINKPSSAWPPPQLKVPDHLPELKAVILAAPTEIVLKPWEKFSNFNQAIRVTSWCRCFAHNC